MVLYFGQRICLVSAAFYFFFMLVFNGNFRDFVFLDNFNLIIIVTLKLFNIRLDALGIFLKDFLG